MGKPRDLANVVATGNILADGAVAPAELTGVTSTAAEINILDGVTATAAELNLMDGVTATTAELNHVDGVTSNVQTQMDTKAPVAGPTFTGTLAAPTINASTALQIGGAAITATAAELNIMDGVTASTSDINGVAGINSNVQTQLNLKAPIDGATFTGTTTIPTADINGGAIDGAIIGANSAAAVTATTLNASTKLQVNGTDVITNARQLSNIASVDSATVTALAAAGVGGGGGTYTATADGAVTAGDLVYLKSTGNVNAIDNDYIAQAIGTRVEIGSVTGLDTGASWWFSNTQAGVAWSDSDNKAYYVTGTLSGNNVTFGTKISLGNSYASGDYQGSVYAASGQGNDANYAVVVFNNSSNSAIYSLVTFSGTTASVVADGSFGSSPYSIRVIYCPDDNCWLLARRGSDEYVYHYKLTRSGSSLTVSSSVNGTTTYTKPHFALGYDPDINRAISVSIDGYAINAYVLDMSGTNPTISSSVAELGNLSAVMPSGTNATADRVEIFYDTVNNHSIIMGSCGSNNPPFYYVVKAATNGTFTVKKISNLQPLIGRDTNNFKTSIKHLDYNDNNRSITMFHGQFTGDDNNNRMHVMYLSADGLTITDPIRSDGFRLDSGSSTINGMNVADVYKGLASQPTGSKVLLYYRASGNNYATAMVFQPTISKGHQYSGIASENISSGSSGDIQILGNVNENQSSLTIGSSYFVQLDGTSGTTDIGMPLVGKAVSATKMMIKNS